MFPWPPEAAAPLALSGTARERGRGQAAGADRDAVARATAGRVEQACAEGLLDAAAQRFLADQRAFHLAAEPHSMDELAGIAEGFGIDEETLFVHLHLGILADLRRSSLPDADGCSAWACAVGADGPLLVKNRDFHGTHLGVQRVFRHEGPDIATGAVLCIGSLGAPGAYSSGINAAGLALADTAIATSDHGAGWLRYFLMSRILAECATVAEALAFIAARTHAGGGSLVMIDGSGDAATVELGHRESATRSGRLVWHTNHFVEASMAACNLAPGDDRIAANSRGRHALLSQRLPASEGWDTAAAAALMASHGETGDETSLCQHAGDGEASTISCAVFACRDKTLYFADGNPCEGRWKRFGLDL